MKAGLALPQEGRIPHSDGKKLMPPGGQLWQSRTPGAWHSRIPPLKENCRGWNAHGQEEALFGVVKAAWKQYCWLEGIPDEACPMPGVF